MTEIERIQDQFTRARNGQAKGDIRDEVHRHDLRTFRIERRLVVRLIGQD